MESFPLVPGTNLVLTCPGKGAEILGQRFAKLFTKVWQRIPERQRSSIHKYWERHAREGDIYVELSDMWGGSETIFGQVRGQGHDVRFSARHFAQMNDKAALAVIAHELAHLYQHSLGIEFLDLFQLKGASSKTMEEVMHEYPGFRLVGEEFPGNHFYRDAAGDVWGDLACLERDANRITRAWGFSREELREYRRRGDYVVSFSATIQGRFEVDAESEDQAESAAVNKLESQMEDHGYDLVDVESIDVTPKQQDGD